MKAEEQHNLAGFPTVTGVSHGTGVREINGAGKVLQELKLGMMPRGHSSGRLDRNDALAIPFPGHTEY